MTTFHVTEPGDLYGREISSLDNDELEEVRQLCAVGIAKIMNGVGTCRFGKYRAQPAPWEWIAENDPEWFGWLVRKRRDNLALYDREIARRKARAPDKDVEF